MFVLAKLTIPNRWMRPCIATRRRDAVAIVGSADRGMGRCKQNRQFSFENINLFESFNMNSDWSVFCHSMRCPLRLSHWRFWWVHIFRGRENDRQPLPFWNRWRELHLAQKSKLCTQTWWGFSPKACQSLDEHCVRWLHWFRCKAFYIYQPIRAPEPRLWDANVLNRFYYRPIWYPGPRSRHASRKSWVRASRGNSSEEFHL